MIDGPLCQACRRPIPWRPYQNSVARACSPGCAGALFKAENPADRVWSKKPERLDEYGNAIDKPGPKDVSGGNGCVRIEYAEDDDDG
jgi:hypothetical protein